MSKRQKPAKIFLYPPTNTLQILNKERKKTWKFWRNHTPPSSQLNASCEKMENKQKQKEKAICVRSINLFFSLALYPQPQQCIPLPKIKKAFQTKKKNPKKIYTLCTIYLSWILHIRAFLRSRRWKKILLFSVSLALWLERSLYISLSFLFSDHPFLAVKKEKKNTNLLLKQ